MFPASGTIQMGYFGFSSVWKEEKQRLDRFQLLESKKWTILTFPAAGVDKIEDWVYYKDWKT